MTNTSKYNSRLLRDPRPAARAARSGVFGIVNPYWKDRAQARKPSTERRRQAYKLLTKNKQ